MSRRDPSKQEMETAIAWLLANEGAGGESERCAAVAFWLESRVEDTEMRDVAREAGVTVGALRRKMRERGAR